ncbi:hypothetical protein DCAR_0624882 [Daucus carota subsp. sativus]|uniref:Uncharacterized protein n=1 Tax=Daucus carota subsp. sativus TaxID=79200 RepID=A0A164W3C9_DAUCS|nr:PREDICTED: uncharacterized protein LOC108225191 [Daucus carota subsp. sativus]XP_017255503.1 PREDICTED: uncharacterized protein LOC108225191 [Daucus carota subsp. sativus]WOH05465.1 hypothetical protein DCAR_0624882 [Daucus carota subsp. sativus]
MYNKVEALREKADAEKLIACNDYVGAREKLLKAKQLFPPLDHIAAMLTVCDILSASRNRVPGYETDYYWVLNIMPAASSIDLKQQYDKLLNLLQPIKGKFSGAALALKYVDEAFSVLSDRVKRLIFDSKRACSWDELESFANPLPSQPFMDAETGVNAQSSLIHSSAQVCNVQNAEGLSMQVHERVDDLGPKLEATCDSNKQNIVVSSQDSSVVSSDMNSEGNAREDIDLSIDDLNSSLGPPRMSDSSWSKRHVAYKKPDQDFFNFEVNKTVENFKIGQVWAVYYYLKDDQNYLYAQINAISKSEVRVSWLKPVPVTLCERRWCDAGLPVACGSFCLDLNLSEEIMSSTLAFSYNCSWVPGVTEEQFEIYPKKGEVWALYEDWDLDDWCYYPEKVRGCKFKFIEILSDFSKIIGGEGACLSKVDGFKNIYQRESEDGNPSIFHISPRDLYILSHNVPAYKFTGGEIDGVVSGMIELDELALSYNRIQDTDSQLMIRAGQNSDFKKPMEALPPVVRSSQCTTLGPKWSVSDFSTGQVWAVYYGEDLMPRRYARLNSVISGDEVGVTFLEPQLENSYDHNLKKVMPIVCGVFQAKETNVHLNISQVSHQVKCQMSTTRPMYKIYPMKGEIWAMYQNWSCKWGPGDYENYKCWIVEILSDFSVDERMVVVRLGEVKGCLTFFQRIQRDGFDMSRVVLKTDILGFSHQIPAFRVPGIGRYGIPENSWHLEPNALPPPFRK